MSKKKAKPEKIDVFVGRNLKNLRFTAGISQTKMGEILGVSYQQLQKYERGSNRLPVSSLYKLKHLLDVPYERFFKGIEWAEDSEKISLIEMDGDTRELFYKIAHIEDPHLKEKIGHIVDVLTD